MHLLCVKRRNYYAVLRLIYVQLGMAPGAAAAASSSTSTTPSANPTPSPPRDQRPLFSTNPSPWLPRGTMAAIQAAHDAGIQYQTPSRADHRKARKEAKKAGMAEFAAVQRAEAAAARQGIWGPAVPDPAVVEAARIQVQPLLIFYA